MFGKQTNFLKEIDALLEKGFNHEQITAMFTTSAVTPTITADIPGSGDEANPLADSPELSAGDTPAAAPVREETSTANAEILAAINDLKHSVQANNIKTMSVETIDANAALESAMAELIRPSFEDKGV